MSFTGITNLIAEIKRCEKTGAIMAAVSLCYVCIDTMAFLSMPANRTNTKKGDFIQWVDTYLKQHPDQPYNYRGIDVYAARCALLHTWGAEAELHRNDSSVTMFGYSDGGLHAYNPDVSDRLVIIGAVSLINDVMIGVETFLKTALEDEELRERLESRADKVMTVFPFSAGAQG